MISAKAFGGAASGISGLQRSYENLIGAIRRSWAPRQTNYEAKIARQVITDTQESIAIVQTGLGIAKGNDGVKADDELEGKVEAALTEIDRFPPVLASHLKAASGEGEVTIRKLRADIPVVLARLSAVWNELGEVYDHVAWIPHGEAQKLIAKAEEIRKLTAKVAPRKKRALLFGLVGVGALGLGTAAVYMYRSKKPPSPKQPLQPELEPAVAATKGGIYFLAPKHDMMSHAGNED